MPARTESELVSTMKAHLRGRSTSRSPESLLAEMVQDGVIEVVGDARGEPLYDLTHAFADLREIELEAAA
jgi:hypothetical protein